MPFLRSLLHFGAKASKASARLAIPVALVVAVSLAGVVVGPAVVSALKPSKGRQAERRPHSSDTEKSNKKKHQRSKRGVEPTKPARTPRNPSKSSSTPGDDTLRPAAQLFGGAALTCEYCTILGSSLFCNSQHTVTSSFSLFSAKVQFSQPESPTKHGKKHSTCISINRLKEHKSW